MKYIILLIVCFSAFADSVVISEYDAPTPPPVIEVEPIKVPEYAPEFDKCWYTDSGYSCATVTEAFMEGKCEVLVVDDVKADRRHVKLNEDGTVKCPAEIDEARRAASIAAIEAQNQKKVLQEQRRAELIAHDCDQEKGIIKKYCEYFKNQL